MSEEQERKARGEALLIQGIKFDQGKPMLGLISSRFLVGLAKVLTFGAKKYAAHNWRKGMATSRYYDALQRHMIAWNDGEDLDSHTADCPPECTQHSGLPHLYHAACCLMFLAETVEVKPELDDRYKHGARETVSSQPGHPVSQDAQELVFFRHPAESNGGRPGLLPGRLWPGRGPGAQGHPGGACPPPGLEGL